MEMTINLKNRISKKWKEFFNAYTNSNDVSKVSSDHGIGYHTLYNIKICNSNVGTETNKNALESLAKVAIENAKASIIKAQTDIPDMENTISEIIDFD